jgi:hypothetical protein
LVQWLTTATEIANSLFLTENPESLELSDRQSRRDHLAEVKNRALDLLEYEGPESALASMIYDLARHRDTRTLARDVQGCAKRVKQDPRWMRKLIRGLA